MLFGRVADGCIARGLFEPAGNGAGRIYIETPGMTTGHTGARNAMRRVAGPIRRRGPSGPGALGPRHECRELMSMKLTQIDRERLLMAT